MKLAHKNKHSLTNTHKHTHTHARTHMNTQRPVFAYSGVHPSIPRAVCGVLQCAAVCCSVLQSAAVCCSVSPCVATVYPYQSHTPALVCCSVLQSVAECCKVLQNCIGVHPSTYAPAAVYCSVLQSIAACCRVLQRVAVCVAGFIVEGYRVLQFHTATERAADKAADICARSHLCGNALQLTSTHRNTLQQKKLWIRQQTYAGGAAFAAHAHKHAHFENCASDERIPRGCRTHANTHTHTLALFLPVPVSRLVSLSTFTFRDGDFTNSSLPPAICLSIVCLPSRFESDASAF